MIDRRFTGGEIERTSAACPVREFPSGPKRVYDQYVGSTPRHPGESSRVGGIASQEWGEGEAQDATIFDGQRLSCSQP
jgi:hypothetical protein